MGQELSCTHETVCCDGCNAQPLVGPRFKCVVCDDYDLCARCVMNGLHREHFMLLIRQPETGRGLKIDSTMDQGVYRLVQRQAAKPAQPAVQPPVQATPTSAYNPVYPLQSLYPSQSVYPPCAGPSPPLSSPFESRIPRSIYHMYTRNNLTPPQKGPYEYPTSTTEPKSPEEVEIPIKIEAKPKVIAPKVEDSVKEEVAKLANDLAEAAANIAISVEDCAGKPPLDEKPPKPDPVEVVKQETTTSSSAKPLTPPTPTAGPLSARQRFNLALEEFKSVIDWPEKDDDAKLRTMLARARFDVAQAVHMYFESLKKD